MTVTMTKSKSEGFGGRSTVIEVRVGRAIVWAAQAVLPAPAAAVPVAAGGRRVVSSYAADAEAVRGLSELAPSRPA